MRGYIFALAVVVAFSGCSQKQPSRVIKPTPTKRVVLPKPVIKQKPIKSVQSNQNLGGAIIPRAQKPMPVIVLRPGQISTIGEPIEKPIEVTPPAPVEPSLNAGNSKSYVTTFKTKKFAFSDAGFLKSENGRTDLQIFAVGKPLMKLKILPSDDICVNQLCNTKHGFNQSYLSGAYPDNLLENVLHARPIFNSQNLKETTNGFMQRIRGAQYDIKYKIVPGMIYFKDVKNKIIIKLKALGR
jgi:hypothetical protein